MDYGRPVSADPEPDLIGRPYLALGQVGYGLGEIGTTGDLIDALSADLPRGCVLQELADLVCA